MFLIVFAFDAYIVRIPVSPPPVNLFHSITESDSVSECSHWIEPKGLTRLQQWQPASQYSHLNELAV